MKFRNIKKNTVVGLVSAFLLLSGCGNAAEQTADSEIAISKDAASSQVATSSQVGTSSSDELLTREVFAMDTYMTFSAYGEDAEAALDEAEEEILRLDQLLAAESEDSEVAQLNKNGGGQLSDDTAYLIERSIALNEETEGAFEITVYPVKQAWGFTDENYRIPTEEELKELLPLVGSDQLELDVENKTVTYQKAGMKIDLGGITKGYASSRLTDIFMKHDVQGMINLGGNVQALGTKPDGSKWRVGVQDPGDDSGLLGILEIADLAVITSGGYERCFEKNGQIYHHIIDPRTGFPADTGLTSVTIVSPDGTLADGLSTFLYIAGEERAEAYWKAHADEFDMILAKEDGTLLVTEGIEDAFSSDYEYEVIYI